MISLDEDALICDLAETYQIYDYRSLPVRLVATLSAGLRDTSRIKMKASNASISLEETLLAMLVDRVEMLRYGFSENARKRKDVPKSVLEMLTKQDNHKAGGFKTPEEFDAWLEKVRSA